MTDIFQTDLYYQGRKAVSKSSINENRSTLIAIRVVEIVPVRVVEIVPLREVPLAVVEMVPVLVVEIVPDLVVEMVPVFPKVVADTAVTNKATPRIVLKFFIARS